MILKGSERKNAAELSRHLMNGRDNDHVELHEIRGFLSDNLAGALMEADAISQGTRCKNFLFSLSLNPPEREAVSVEVFEAAVEMAEQRLGLDGQPRAIVFHEKEGRRHAHAVWSRIDADTMTARNLPFYKQRLTELSRELYLEHGWDMPRGLMDRALRNPLNFSREEWQQAMVQRQRAQRRELDMMHTQRQEEEQRQRAARVPKGVRGLWGWVTGQNRKIRFQNELDAQRGQERDRMEREAVIQKQLAERRVLQERVKATRAQQHESMQELTRDVAHYARLGRDEPDKPLASKEPKQARGREKQKTDRGHRSGDEGQSIEPR